MHFFYIVFISLVNNLDNIGVRIAYSLRGIKISLQKNLLISLITFIISCSSSFLGAIISNQFNQNLSSYITMVLLIGMGLWTIIDSFRKKHKKPEETNIENSKNIFTILDSPERADLDNSKEIDFNEAIFLGVALSINNICGGLSAGMMKLNSLYVGLFSAIICFLALWTGNYLTRLFNRFNLGNKAIIISGIIMILIGIKQVI